MLYLHCGWPRTGTTSLQTALFEHRRELAEAGIVYPEMWLSHEGPTHHGLFQLLRASLHSAVPLKEFRTFLDRHSDRDVLFSAEVITTWLVVAKKPERLLDLLGTAREVMQTRSIWTLRRVDDELQSSYLRRLAYGVKLEPPDQHFARIGDLGEFFARIVRVGEATTGVAYVKYNSGGTYNDELLWAFGIPVNAQYAIREQLLSSRRLNSSLTHKQAVVLRDLDTLSARAGVELDWVGLRDAFLDGDLGFEDDRRCELLGAEARWALHEGALASARAQGFTPYVDFFAHSEVEAPKPVSLDPDQITDRDLERLVNHLRQVVPA
jgi:hypothetical protein